ncbi:hypothetical protein SIL87_15555 [Acidiphilium acidophilum]|uniref:Transposase n=1 Tax=Acidiphilium acidophilum TaxID=76588 RepID=A0AAW9DVX3_ACIAO|nr:hypothetical protein [Acidiphilium acidophilum]
MPDDRRNRIAGGTCFVTVNRRPDLLTRAIEPRRTAIAPAEIPFSPPANHALLAS